MARNAEPGFSGIQIQHSGKVACTERYPDDGAEERRPPVDIQRQRVVEDAGGAKGGLQPLVPARRAGRVERTPLCCNSQEVFVMFLACVCLAFGNTMKWIVVGWNEHTRQKCPRD